MKSYVFQAGIEQDEDGRWSAWISALPGCTAWGYTKEEALQALKDALKFISRTWLRREKNFPQKGFRS
jgi:predicted RNase H-like HicB family nuclease